MRRPLDRAGPALAAALTLLVACASRPPSASVAVPAVPAVPPTAVETSDAGSATDPAGPPIERVTLFEPPTTPCYPACAAERAAADANAAAVAEAVGRCTKVGHSACRSPRFAAGDTATCERLCDKHVRESRAEQAWERDWARRHPRSEPEARACLVACARRTDETVDAAGSYVAMGGGFCASNEMTCRAHCARR